MSSGCIVGMELISENSISKWRNLIGPTNVREAREKAPQSLRALYGTGDSKNACHGSDSGII